MRPLPALILILPSSTMAIWQNAIATDGQVDAFGIAFFFYLFFCYVNIKDGYKESTAKGNKCVLDAPPLGWRRYSSHLCVGSLSWCSWSPLCNSHGTLSSSASTHHPARKLMAPLLNALYPARDDHARRLVLPWRGHTVKTITHPHFGPEPVEVFAIDVRGQP